MNDPSMCGCRFCKPDMAIAGFPNGGFWHGVVPPGFYGPLSPMAHYRSLSTPPPTYAPRTIKAKPRIKLLLPK